MQDNNGNWPFGCKCTAISAARCRYLAEANSAAGSRCSRAAGGVVVAADQPGAARSGRDSRVRAFATDDNGLPPGGHDPLMISVRSRAVNRASLPAPHSSGNSWMSNSYNCRVSVCTSPAPTHKMGYAPSGNGFTTPVASSRAVQLPVQQRRAESDHASGAAERRRHVARVRDTHQDHGTWRYAQDKWTIDRMTLGYGLRFDYFANTIPENRLGPVAARAHPQRHVPGAEELCVEGYLAEVLCGVRPVRHREDGAEGVARTGTCGPGGRRSRQRAGRRCQRGHQTNPAGPMPTEISCPSATCSIRRPTASAAGWPTSTSARRSAFRGFSTRSASSNAPQPQFSAGVEMLPPPFDLLAIRTDQ